MARKDSVFLIIILIVTLTIVLNKSSFIVLLFLLISRIIATNRITAGVFLLLFGGPLGGIVRYEYPALPIYGVIVMSIGAMLLFPQILKYFKTNTLALVFIVLLWIVFVIAYVNSSMAPENFVKLISIILNSVLFYIAYATIFNEKNVDNNAICQSLLLYSLLTISFVQSHYDIIASDSMFSWFRLTLTYSNNEYFDISYQQVGMNVLFASAFILSKKNFKEFHLYNILLLALSVYVLLISGARQALAGFAFIVLFRYIFNSRKKRARVIIASLFSLIVLLLFVNANETNTSELSTIYSSSLGERQLLFQDSFSILKEYPLFGIGLGDFSKYSFGLYPHNIFLEILCEMGFCGLILLTFLVCVYLSRQGFTFNIETSSGNLYCIIVLCALSRYLFSADLTESVAFFSACFAVTPILNKTKMSI